MSDQEGNHLADETSPYLLQHAHNPVDWHAWNTATLEKATAKNKPIFLSIGYSACHWCHVMAHESFEDRETAEIMNEHFINIKVDKEERPDIDKIYQTAQQILTKRTGGWPLSMFLTPDDHIPFFGGTYFPLDAKHGLPSFKQILQMVIDSYQQERHSITKQNKIFLSYLEKSNSQWDVDSSAILNPTPLTAVIEELYQNFDHQFGGFGNAPKFPHPSDLEYLLRQYPKQDSLQQQRIEMIDLTLEKMAFGGLYDQLGGGFYRYSVDRAWMIPHFEKMLYDNGLLLTLYSQAWQITQKPLYKEIARGTADWVIREMQSPEGGYYSSLDADSEGEEGKFYVWTREESQQLLDDGEYAIFAKYYGLDQAPNFESNWHLRVTDVTTDIEELRLLDQAKIKLLQRRATRIRPDCDDKILTAWNALMIKGMATAAFVFDDEQYLDSAAKALQFIYHRLYSDGNLLATYRNGKAHLNAYLDDYAFLIDATLTLLQCRWDQKWLDMATQLADRLIDSFIDKKQGGFFFTADNHEKLICRSKDYMDGALPSGNGVVVRSLNKLGYLIGDMRYLEVAESVLRSAWPAIEKYPSAHATLIHALEENISPAKRIIIFSTTGSENSWREAYRKTLGPFDSLLILPENATNLPGSLAQYARDKIPVAYVCSGHSCQKIDTLPLI